MDVSVTYLDHWKKQVKFYFQNMLHPTRKEIEVLVAIEDITQSGIHSFYVFVTFSTC